MEQKPEEPIEEPVHKGSGKGFYVFGGAIILILILFFGIAYYMNTHKPQINNETVVYNGFPFVYYPDVQIWKTQWQNEGQLYNIYFHFNPLEAEKVPIYQKSPLSGAFNASSFYVSFDANATNNTDYFKIAVAELDLALVKIFERTPVGACSANNSIACERRPIKNCDNTEEAVFYLVQQGEPSIVLDGNCVIIQGNDKELVRAVDRLLYHWYRIIPNPDLIIIDEKNE